MQDLLGEVVPWHQLKHRNISRFIGFTFDNDHAALVSEWQHYGNIMNFLQEHPDADRLVLVRAGLYYKLYLFTESPPHLFVRLHKPPKHSRIFMSGALPLCTGTLSL